MARFTQFGDLHVRDKETYHELPVNFCTLHKLPDTRGLYVATVEDEAYAADFLLRIDPVWTKLLNKGGLERSRGIVIDFEYEECTYTTIPPYANQYAAGLLVPHVVALQIGFDPTFYADGLPIFK